MLSPRSRSARYVPTSADFDLSLYLCNHKSDHMSKWASCDGKTLERLKERPGDATGDMRAYWDFPGVAIWTREGTAYMGRRDRDSTCASGEGTETACYARRDHFVP